MKAQLLETLLQHLRPSRILEVGCYVGYSAVRFGAAVQWQKGEVCSVEMVSWFGIMDVFFLVGVWDVGKWGESKPIKASYIEVENQSGVPVSALSCSVLLGWSFESEFYVLPQTC